MDRNRTKTAVVALGGNAITRPGMEDTIANQFANTRASLGGIVALVRQGFGVVITHGNGPQVGNALLRIELARERAPFLPLGVLVADTEGGMGYMIEQSLQNRLRGDGVDRQVVSIITQMLVDRNDPALDNPTKFIGQFYSKEKSDEFSRSRGWAMKQDGDRGWRRVVPSPKPLEAIAAPTIKRLVDDGSIVIAAGGGGIPIFVDDKGNYEGVDAVIDKDQASAVLANEINADMLAILTDVDQVMTNFGTPEERPLGEVTVSQLKALESGCQFPAGSMGPKIRAAIEFIEGGGSQVVIASIDNSEEALIGRAGTRIVPD
ncbi:MAG: carbamate kinase [Candidatus Zixiibacteriota bacterium]